MIPWWAPAALASAALLPQTAGQSSAAQVPSAAPAGAVARAPATRVLVMPFDTDTKRPATFWLGEGMAMLVADALAEQGIAAIPREDRVAAFEELHLPTSASLSRATVIRVGQLVGAAEVVFGTVVLDGGTLTVRARGLEIGAGRFRAEVVETGPITDIHGIAIRLARRIMVRADWPASSEAPRVPATRVDAFELFVKGLLAEKPADRLVLFKAALDKQPSYDQALLASWTAFTEQGNHGAALAAARAVPADSPLADRARFRAGLSELELGQKDEAFATFKALADRRPSAAALNNLGVVQLRRGSPSQTGRATYFFTKAAENDPDDPDLVFNLGYAYWLDRDTQGAVYWLREAVRRDPADGDAHYVLGTALQALAAAAEATREKELARRLSSKYEEWERRAAAGGDPVPRGLERLKLSMSSARPPQLDAAVTNTAQRDQSELATFYYDRARRLANQGNDAEALRELRRALYLSPYRADALLLLGRIHHRAGRWQDAIDAYRIAIWSEDSVAAHVLLGESLLAAGDPTAAKLEALRALGLDAADTAARALLTRAEASAPR